MSPDGKAAKNRRRYGGILFGRTFGKSQARVERKRAESQSQRRANPLHYIDENQKLAVDQTLAPIVLESFTMYADGYLIKDIVKRFYEKGIVTRLGKKMSYKMSYNMIQYMLTNRKYIGEYRYNDKV